MKLASVTPAGNEFGTSPSGNVPAPGDAGFAWKTNGLFGEPPGTPAKIAPRPYPTPFAPILKKEKRDPFCA
jgi:hypothetical protein